MLETRGVCVCVRVSVCQKECACLTMCVCRRRKSVTEGRVCVWVGVGVPKRVCVPDRAEPWRDGQCVDKFLKSDEAPLCEGWTFAPLSGFATLASIIGLAKTIHTYVYTVYIYGSGQP